MKLHLDDHGRLYQEDPRVPDSQWDVIFTDNAFYASHTWIKDETTFYAPGRADSRHTDSHDLYYACNESIKLLANASSIFYE